jgi:hypothetical protein
MMAYLKSPWLPLSFAVLFAGLAWAIPNERHYLLALAGSALFWGAINLISGGDASTGQ